MKYKKLGVSNLKVSQFSLGTMTFGQQCDEIESFKILDHAFENGINFLDTAEMYPIYPSKKTFGKTEEIIGKWTKKNKNRDKIIIGTKIASCHPDGIGATELSWIREGGKNLRFDKKNFKQAIEGSLKRLKTDYIDLYQLHWPERNVPVFGKLDFKYDPKDINWTPILEVLENLNDLVKEGKIRYFGVSNETAWGVMTFLRYSEKYNLPRIVSIQNCYNLINRVFDISNSEISLRENCSLLAYSPIAGGRLTGKYLNLKKPEKSRYSLWPGRFSRHHTKRGEQAILKYSNLASKLNISLVSLAYAFVISRPFVSSCIIGVTSLSQLKEDIKNFYTSLSNKTLSEVNAIHYDDPNPCV